MFRISTWVGVLMAATLFGLGVHALASSPGALVQLPKTGQTTSYTAGDDGDIQAGVAWPVPRFTDHGDGTATDHLTGLMWTKDPFHFPNKMTWPAAVTAAYSLSAFGYSDWRLPNYYELTSLIDYGRQAPALPAGHPFLNTGSLTNAVAFWTSTPARLGPHADSMIVVPYHGGAGGNFHLLQHYAWACRTAGTGTIELLKTGITTSYVAGDDGDLEFGKAWPSPRFVDHGDGTVTDKLTGLMWTKDSKPASGVSWHDAHAFVASMNTGGGTHGYTDWRVPNGHELMSVTDASQAGSLPAGHPFTNAATSSTDTVQYWTSMTDPDNSIAAARSWFTTGPSIAFADAKVANDSFRRVWPVRGGCVTPPNTAPVADGGGNVTIDSSAQASTTLGGTATDADGDALTCRWLDGGGTVVAGPNAPTGSSCPLDLGALSALGVGNHTFSLEVSDGTETVTDTVVVTVENSAPVASPSGGGTVELGTAVSLMGDVADFDGDELDYEWREGATVLASGTITPAAGGAPSALTSASVTLGLGVHVITLAVDDGVNEEVPADIEIEVIDTTAPSLTLSADRTILWPPNHKMVKVTVQADASDLSGGTLLRVFSITSSEPADASADGTSEPDFELLSLDGGTGEICLNLRAERAGSGDGRTYTVTVEAKDTSGNCTLADIVVTAPHDKTK